MLGADTVVALSWWATIPLIVVGGLLHFVYDWSGHNRVVAVFGAVNESYWEHIKIAAWPTMLFFGGIGALGGVRYPSFVPAVTVALYSIPVTMVGAVYAYKAVTRRNILWVDIAVFALSILVGQGIFVALFRGLEAGPVVVIVAGIYLAGIVAAYLVFTLRPPGEPDVFVDPLTRAYGIDGHATE